MYVVDAGKVKQQSYDSISESTCLTSTDISQACAKQRAGRAGRIQNGWCYRLYSLEQYEVMEKYTLPEILRVPLTEICLNAKMLAGKLSIEEFLLKALQPPSLKNIRQSIELLKKINALDTDENITYLGIHLASMPVDCQLGKMLLYSILLRCIEPVVTIVSILSVKDPFMLPLGNEGEKINKIKKGFGRDSLSDHQMLLNAFDEWSKCKRRHEFCEENYISNGNMQMIQGSVWKLFVFFFSVFHWNSNLIFNSWIGVRRLILGHLRMAEFIADDSARNQRKLNENGLKWEVIKACLVAGLYPNVCRISTLSGQIFSKQDKKLAPHLSSIIRERRAKGQIDPNVLSADAEWLVHGEKSRIAAFSLIRNITVVSGIDVILFAGPVNLPETNLVMADDNKIEVHSDVDCDNIPDLDYDDDDDDDDEFFALPQNGESGDARFNVDDWITFIVDENEAQLLFKLRVKFASMLSRFLKGHTTFQPKNKETRMLNVLTEVIRREDHIEKKLKAARAKAEHGSDDSFVEDPSLIWQSEIYKKPIPDRPLGLPMLSDAYTQSIQPEHQRNKKKKKGRNNNKKRMPDDKRSDNWRNREPSNTTNAQHNELNQQPSTSNVNSQQRLTQGLFNNIQMPFTAPNFPNIGAQSFRPAAAAAAAMCNDFITNRYFILTVPSPHQIYASLRRDWKFQTPLPQMRKFVRESAPAKILLLLHVQNAKSILCTGEFTSHKGAHRITIDKVHQRPYRPLL